jgi:hypothetical protein
MKKSKLLYIFILLLIFVILFCIFYNETKKEKFTEKFTTNNKYVCFYAYYEKNQQYKENLEYFLNNRGILDNVDYYIIINGDSTVSIPEKDNIKIIKRENKGFDFGAWSHALKKIDKSYDYYIFINTSVRGPYVKENENWLDKFMELFNKPDVKLVGSTINILEDKHIFGDNLVERFNHEPPYSHVQSMFFILNNEAMQFLNEKDFFNEESMNNETNIHTIILKNEISLSQYILENNWNINCIVPEYRDQDYRTLVHNINTGYSDVVMPNGFFGRSLTPEEVIFYKAWRFE